MASLKAFLPALGRILRTSPNALYSRQRALVDFGALDAVKGRGPGSGVLLTGESVAALLISMLAADALQDADDRVRQTCEAKPQQDNKTCPMTAARTFKAALGKILETKSLCEQVSEIAVGRDEFAQIRANDKTVSDFRIRSKRERPPIFIVAEMSGATIREISNALREATAQFEMKEVLE